MLTRMAEWQNDTAQNVDGQAMTRGVGMVELARHSQTDGANAAHDPVPPIARKGRGAVSNGAGRFEAHVTEAVDDGWQFGDDDLPTLRTSVTDETPRTIITTNQSPDIPFDRSINPYRGCEHGCVYCYARPSHAYLGLSPGLDFESVLFAKPNAAELLDRELRKPGYAPAPIMLGANTDPYQPLERDRRITRDVLQVLSDFNHPVIIVTKSGLIRRDLDLLAPMAARGLVLVAVSVTTLDPTLSRKLEPRAMTPKRRLEAIENLTDAGVPVAVFASPMIPFINDAELERILEAASEAGAGVASYILLRLPMEIKELFAEWLETHAPGKAKHVLNLLRESRHGNLNVSEFGERMRGAGVHADLLADRFRLACKRLGLRPAGTAEAGLDCGQFRPPPRAGDQMSLL